MDTKLQPGQDLDDFLGVKFEERRKVRRAPVPVECGQSPPVERRRQTEWNNFSSFAFDGYVAKVVRYHCQCCDNLWDHLLGVFICEVHQPSGTRRMQAMAAGGDWPAQGGHRKEVEDQEVKYCGHCIGDLGFDREVDGKGKPYTLVIGGEGR